MRDLTLVMPYYDNPEMFVTQQQQWRDFPNPLKARLRVIVVDDCSPRWPALPNLLRDTGVNLQLYRTLVDVRWNWLFCRNLAMAKAETEWALMTDMDHVLRPKVFARLLEHELDPRFAYRLSRVDAPNMTPYKPHPNTWLMTRALFDRVGGYDETFSGFYGTDGEFRDRVVATAGVVVMLPHEMVRYERTVIADASTTTYTRKEPDDKANVRRIIAERRPGWKPKRLSFPYERLA